MLSDNTKTVYASGITCFRKFLQRYKLVKNRWELPIIGERTLLYFVSYCFSVLHLRYGTIKIYLAGVRFAYLQAGIPNPLVLADKSNVQQLHSVLKAVKRIQGLPAKPRMPITIEVLEKMCCVLHQGVFSPFLECMLLAACTAAFAGFLRCGEFTVRNPQQTYLRMRDVQMGNDCYILHLPSSKTDPFRRGTDIHIFQTNSTTCPTNAMAVYLQVRRASGATQQDPLFITPANDVLCRQFFIQHIRDVLVAAKIHAQNYSGHSFRIGAATTAASRRIESHLIMQLGRWQNDAYRGYIRTPLSAIKQAQVQMALV